MNKKKPKCGHKSETEVITRRRALQLARLKNPIYDTKLCEKVRRKYWEPFKIYQLTSTANSAIICGFGWVGCAS